MLLEKVKQQNKVDGIGKVKNRGQGVHGWPHLQGEFSTKVYRKQTLGYGKDWFWGNMQSTS